MKKVKGLGFLVFILCLSLVLPSLVFDVSAATTGFLNLNKLMDTSSTSSGSFTLTADSRFFIVSKAEPAENLVEVVQLASSQFAEDGKPTSQTLPIVYGTELFSRDGDILIVINDTYAPDAYRISVDSKIKITASNDRGVLYGLNTLLKYFRAEGENTVPCFTVSNTPDVKERIFMLDCARKYFTKDWICNLIREISWMGYNTLELHFTEDGGMRLDIWDPAYFTSANGNDFTWVLGGNGACWVTNAERDNDNADRYLSAAELVEILNVAKQYRIDVIPAFDTPWHSEYMCKKYEAYATANATKNNTFSYNGKTYTYKNAPRIYFSSDTTYDNRYNGVDVTNEQARAFVYAIMSDYADFFKQYAGSTDFNMGADEVAFTSWDGTKIYAVGWDTFASSNKIGSTAYDTFVWFVNNVYDLLASKGYNVRAYNDFLGRKDLLNQQNPNSNIEIVYWTSDAPGATTKRLKTAADYIAEGRTVYTGIETYCYYVLRTVGTNDARDPAFVNFQFNKATAENIWTYWEPTLVSKLNSGLPLNTPQTHLSADQVEGAYYMFWGDEAGISTEAQIWNGVNTDGKWNIRERMWANINKMWKINADGSSLSHDSVQALRTTVGDFPGYPGFTTNADGKDVAATTTLPAAQTLALAPPPAEPSGNGSISISNAIDGQVYSAYRILDLESYDKTTGIYRYKVSERWASFFESGAPGLNYMTVSEGGSVSWNSGADPAAFAKAAKAFADANGIPPNAVAEATGTPAQAYIGNVPRGYYLVDTSIGSLCSLDTTDDDAVVSEKNTEPEIDKKLKDKAEDTEYTDNANSASIGDTVYYQLEITVGRGAINYVVEDTFDNGLTFDAVKSVEVVGATAGKDYTLTVDGQTFKIEFNNDYLETKAGKSDIVIHYQATVNKDAFIRTANKNTVMLRWGNGTRYDTDFVETFVYDFSYTKVDGAGNPLNGAKFKLYDAETGGNKIPVVYVGTREIDGTEYNVYRKALAGEGVDMNGTHVIVEGFDAEDSGNLYLHETESPAGYNILTGRVAVDLSTENRLDKVIVNRSGQELPSTGGFGTAAFIFVGSLLMLAAMVLFSTEKKMSVR